MKERYLRIAAWSIVLTLALAYALIAQQAVSLRVPRNAHSICPTNMLVIGTNAVLGGSRMSGWGTNIATASLPRTVLNVLVYNYHSADLWLMAVDWATLTNSATNGVTPNMPATKIIAGSYGGWDWGPQGRVFTNGVILASSTTPMTLTNLGAGSSIPTTNFTFDVNYYETIAP